MLRFKGRNWNMISKHIGQKRARSALTDIGHKLAEQWEKRFTLHIYFMILVELEEIQ